MQIDRPIAIAIILFIILLLVFFLVLPEYNTFKALQTDLGEKRAEYNAQHEYYTEIAKTYSDLRSHDDDIKKIDDALSEDPNLGRTIYFLQEKAAGNGLVVKNLFLTRPSQAADNAEKDVKEISFSLGLMGEYSALAGFINSLENSSRIFEINSISFGSESRPPYSFSLQIKTFSY